MKILFLGYSNILRNKILPGLQNKKKIVCEIATRKKIDDKFFTRVYSDYDQAIKKTKFKIVYISLINSLHHKYCKKALLLGKHVIVDKPICLKSKKLLELINLAKQKGLMLEEATVFFFSKRFKNFFSKISFKDKINININFSIPKLQDENFRNFVSKGGGCYNDMSSYAIMCIYLFYKKVPSSLKLIFKKEKKMIKNFSIKIIDKNFILSGNFKFNSKYKNFINVKNGKKNIFLPFAFSQIPGRKNYFSFNNKKKLYNYEDNFYNFLTKINNIIKNKNSFNKQYTKLYKLAEIRKEIEKKL